MTTFETYSIFIALANIVILLIGFIFAWSQIRGAKEQLRLIKKSHDNDHDFNRRLAAQDALRNYNYSLLDSPLRERFDYLNIKNPIPLNEIKEAFEENKTLQSNAHQLLNYYEGLARGVNQGIFDEDIVRVARKNAMTMSVKAFNNYIDHRRNISPKAWIQLTHIVEKWTKQETQPAIRTAANKD